MDGASSCSILTKNKNCKTNIVGLNYQALSPSLIENLQKEGLDVWAWTVNDPNVMTILINWNIDAIITDNPVLSAGSQPVRAINPRW